MLLLSGSPKPMSLINVVENGGGICCSRPWLILCGGSVPTGDEPLSACHLWILFSFSNHRITSGSPKTRCREGGRWKQLAFQFHQQINEIKFTTDTIVFALSVPIKKEGSTLCLCFLCFHFPHCISFYNYVEEELSLWFNLVSLKIDDGATNAGFEFLLRRVLWGSNNR